MAISDFYKDYTLNRIIEGADEWSVLTTSTGTYSGYIQPVSGNEVFQEGKAGEKVTDRLYTTASVDAEYNDKITQDSKTYSVIFSNPSNGITNQGRHKEILLSRYPSST